MKRRSRTKFSKDKSINYMKPIPLEKIGTVDDPCFGKHHDLNAPECGRCGDSELCSIAQAQKLKFKRKEIEAKQPFKDIQTLVVTWKTILKPMKVILRKNAKGLTISSLKEKVVRKIHIHESDFDKAYKKLKSRKIFTKYFIINSSLIKIKNGL